MRSMLLLSCGLVLAATATTSVSSQSPKPIATSDGTIEGVRVEVTEFRRTSGDILSLRFTIVNDSDRPLQVGDVGVGAGALIDGASYTIGGVHAIDAVGKKKYFVARDSAGACVCSQFKSVAPKSRSSHWARFAAPPAGVERMTIVIPPFAPMDDVPAGR